MAESRGFGGRGFGGRGSLRARLAYSFLAVIGIFLFLIAASLVLIRGAYGELSSFQRDQSEINAMSAAIEAASIDVDNFLSSGNRDYLESSRDRLDEFGAYARALRARLPPAFRFPLIDLENMAATYRENAAAVERAYSAGVETIYLNRSKADLSRLKGYIAADCGQLLGSYLSRVRERMAVSRATLERNENLTYLAVVVVGALAAAFALRTADGISKPLHRLAETALAFARGDLSIQPVEYRGDDEIGTLVASFNRMTVEIRDLVEDVKKNAELAVRLRGQEVRAAEAEASLRRTEFELLQAQINPHFLFNALAAATALSRIEEAPNTRSAVESIAQIMRYTLSAKEGPSTIEREFETVRNYLYLQGVRFGKRLAWSVEAEDGCGQVPIPPFSVQPFAENAVIHGIEPRESGGTVAVRARRSGDGGVEISIRDDGVGMDAAMLAEINAPAREAILRHFGVGNVARRLELVYGAPVVRVESAPGAGTTVTVRLPAEKT